MKLMKVTLLLVALAGLPLANSARADANIPPEIQQMNAFLGLMQKFYGIVDSMDQVSNDPTKAAIMQMFKIQEIYEQRGEKAKAAGVFRMVIKESKNPALRNAATIMLGDLLKETGQADAAIDALERGLKENIRLAN